MDPQYTMAIIWGVVSFVSVFGIVLLICLIFYWLPEPHKLESLSPVLDTEVLKRGKTFDLIAVAYTSFTCNLVKMFTRSRWSHVCMLYRAPTSKQLYVIEAMRTRKYPHEVQIINYEHWLEGNKSFDKIYLPFSDQTVTKRKNFFNPETYVSKLIMHFFRRGMKTNMNVFDWISTLKDKPYPRDVSDQRWHYDDYSAFCTEFIVLLLQHVDIMQKKWDPSCYSPVRMMYDIHKDLVHPSSYSARPLHLVSLQQ